METVAIGEALVCTSTGLNLVSSAGSTIYRVAKAKYGPLGPPRRSNADPVEKWSRWDTIGRTVYGGSTAEGAFTEVLGYITPDPPAIKMTDLFDDVTDEDAATFDAQIAKELPDHGAMAYRTVSQGWRQDRLLYSLSLPAEGWFVDVTGANSIASINRNCRDLLDACHIDQLTISHLTATSDAAKMLTTGVATWIRNAAALFDGSRPHGVTYPSKWGSTLANWAMWLRRTDDGVGSDLITQNEVFEIGRHTKPLVEAAKLREMKIF